MKAFLEELKRRNVTRVGGIYLVAGWILMQAAALLEDALSMPAWFDTIIVSLILLGFPVVLLFAWLFEVTPEGLRRTPAVDTPEGQAFAASTRRRLDRTLIAVIVLAVAVVAADRLLPRATAPASSATSATSQATAPAESQRAAFFGFTAADTSELSTQIAGVATDETFAAMTAMNLQTAARGDTLSVAPDMQLDKAAALGARYALGGNVRTNGDHIAVTIQLDDSKTRAALWQSTLTGGAAQRESLPVQAAAQATNLLECLIQVRPDMVREDASALALVTRACGFTNYFYDRQTIDHWRDVLQVAPRSVRAEVGIAQGYWFQSQSASEADRPALLREVRDASNRALAIEPNHSGARVRLATLDIATDRPLADILAEVDSAFRDRVREKEVTTASVRMALLSAVGRSSEAARVGRSDAAVFLLNSTVQLQYGHALTNSGQTQAGLRVLQSMNRRLVNPVNWQALAFVTISAGEDIAAVVAAAPPDVSPETIACMQDVSFALRLTASAKAAAAQRLLACVRMGHIQPWSVFPLLAQLGDLDAAFVIAGQSVRRSNPLSFNSSALYLFSPASRPLRADQRFLRLVKELGIYQYWLETGTQPDVCETPEERSIEVCLMLRTDQAGR